MAPEKYVGPSTAIVSLDLELDAISIVIRLPDDKLQCMSLLVQKWMGKKACQKRDLKSFWATYSMQE